MSVRDPGGGRVPDPVGAAVAAAHRQDWARVVAAAARTAGGDLGLAEEASQDAFVAALETWGQRGIPSNPVAWLTRTAQRRVMDARRREATLRRKLLAFGSSLPQTDDSDDTDQAPVLDDRLRLVFTCCHPALAAEARVALTLRMVGGLTTAEIAHAFLVPEATMAARITRAKRKIVTAGVPYRVPTPEDVADRLGGLLAVIHLVFTTGHTAPAGQSLQRRDLAADAVDLSRMLAVLMPDEPEALGLLALLELTYARRNTRQTSEGALVLLAEQDRSRWDTSLISQGLRTLERAGRRLGSRPPGRYLLQAGIAAAHAEAPTFADTDWVSIVALYELLHAAWPSPVVALNRAVAVAYRDGPEAGLDAVAAIADDPVLVRYHYLPAVRADLLRQVGRSDEARAAYEQALAQVTNEAERAFLRARLADLKVSLD